MLMIYENCDLQVNLAGLLLQIW